MLQALTNRDYYKSIYKETLDRVVKERFDKVKESTQEIDHDYLIYYLNIKNIKYIKYIKYINILSMLYC